MICPKCHNQNDDEYIFCVNCGASIPNTSQKTEAFPSVLTVIGAKTTAAEDPRTVNFQTNTETVSDANPVSGVDKNQRKSRSLLMAVVAVVVLLAIGAVGLVAGLVYFNRPIPSPDPLPDHLGLFAVNPENKSLTEIVKREAANIKEARDAIAKESVNPSLRTLSELILYSDSSDIKIDDLKLVRLDSITDEGKMREFDFKASLVDDKPAMKRIKLDNALVNGKYAFALFNGAFDEGKHKLWPFQVDGSNNSQTVTGGRELALALKETKPAEEKRPPANTASNTVKIEKPEVEIPSGARVAYCNATDVIVRNAPSLKARKINGLRRGQKVYIISYSDNYDQWKGISSNWAYIQTEKGSRGWVFTPFISY
ncbi:MAG: SH3 domain-containing protein [Pyrinomonadaceae bacterium]